MARSADLPETVPTLPHTSQVYLGQGALLPANEPEEGEGDDDGGHEATAAGPDLVDACVYFLHELVVFVAHGYILIGAQLPCKGGIGMMIRGQSAGSSIERG